MDRSAQLQNSLPQLIAAISADGLTFITGNLERPNTTFVIEFFDNAQGDPFGYGEGQDFIGSTTVQTDSSGLASFSVHFAVSVHAGSVITATATDPTRGTSEFSRWLTVAPLLFNTGTDASDQVVSGNPNDLHYTVQYFATPGQTNAPTAPATVPTGGTPLTAYVATNSAYVPDDSTSRWVTIDPNTNQVEPVGLYLWTMQFTVPAGVDPTEFTVQGQWSSDNQGTAIYLNGR